MKRGASDEADDPPNLNTGKRWSKMALLDLANCIRVGDSVDEAARFMCRSRREIRKKIAELEHSGELASWIEKAAAAAGRRAG